MKFPHVILVSLFLLMAQFGVAQQHVEVVLKSDEHISGKLLTIGSTYILINTSTNTVRLNRDEILYMANTREIPKPKSKRPGMEINPISKNWTIEIQSGITVISPFALRADLYVWRKLNPKWSLGFGPTLQFYRFTSMNGALRGRYMGRPDKYIRPFLEGGFSMSFYETVAGMNFQGSLWGTQVPPDYQASFSRVKQIEFGPGLYMDTGLGVAFTAKLLWNATWFNITQMPSGSRTEYADYTINTAALLTGFIF